MRDEKTIFEKIIDREIPSEILFENETGVILKDINPQSPIHVLIVPKKRIARVAEADADDVKIIGELILMAKKFAADNNITSFRLVINNGRLSGETVPHLHIHLLSGRPMAWPPG